MPRIESRRVWALEGAGRAPCFERATKCRLAVTSTASNDICIWIACTGCDLQTYLRDAVVLAPVTTGLLTGAYFDAHFA